MSEVAGTNAGMKFLSAMTGNEWVTCVAPEGPDDEARAQAENHRQRLDQLLTEVLLSENLVVLAGLGTTLCLNKADGPRVAPDMSDLWGAAAQKAGTQFEALKAKVRYSTPTAGENIETLLSQCQLSQALHPAPEIAQFIADSEALIVEKCRFVKETTDLEIHETFLRKVARRPTRQPRTKLFTTNYDLCVETAASHTRFIVVDGFSHTQPQEFDGSYFAYDFVRREQDREIPDYIPNVFHLYKIHGSVDWELRDSQIVKTPLPVKPLIIYPRHSKFEASYDQPFIEMMSRFQVALRQPNSGLLLLGVGFNDPHIWQPVMSALRSNVSLKAIVVDPVLHRSSREPVKQMEKLIRAGDTRLVLLAAGFENVVPILPDLVAATEDERHRERLRAPGATR
jgi:hypothetical protein